MPDPTAPPVPSGPAPRADQRLAGAALLAAFEGGTLPADTFDHREHVRLAWTYLEAYPLEEALPRLCRSLQAFAAAQGAPTKYHATITWAFMLLLHERRMRHPAADWEAFATAHPDLLAWPNPVLKASYRPETLASSLARRCFVWPDASLE